MALGSAALDWAALQPLVGAFWLLVLGRLERRQQAGRLKQWLNLLRQRYPQAQQAYAALRTVHDPAPVTQWLQQHGMLTAAQAHQSMQK